MTPGRPLECRPWPIDDSAFVGRPTAARTGAAYDVRKSSGSRRRPVLDGGRNRNGRRAGDGDGRARKRRRRAPNRQPGSSSQRARKPGRGARAAGRLEPGVRTERVSADAFSADRSDERGAGRGVATATAGLAGRAHVRGAFGGGAHARGARARGAFGGGADHTCGLGTRRCGADHTCGLGARACGTLASAPGASCSHAGRRISRVG
jgi:hypothetical protein